MDAEDVRRLAGVVISGAQREDSPAEGTLTEERCRVRRERGDPIRQPSRAVRPGGFFGEDPRVILGDRDRA